ncbi:Hsp20/alpha crystallin family protein [Radiobacillus sp. PE A8.2]|uniref:Hsp20/alpha crystallin family protein n=1 Tax=Radiobacillus sp. PE A8.2 TaxID=3380349 RepID=UPI00388F7783
MDPFQNMNDWKKNMDTFFGQNFWKEFDDVLKPPLPQINLYKYDNELVCYVNLPGVRNINKVDVFVDYATLELRGMIDINHSGGQVIKEEILQGVFERKVELPYPVRHDKVDASYQYGLLVLRLHRLVKSDGQKHRTEIIDLEEH